MDPPGSAGADCLRGLPGTIHDFVMPTAPDQAAACRMATDATTMWIIKKQFLKRTRRV